MSNGSCLCGAVTFEVTGPLRPVIACHCIQCRKQTGTYMSATAARHSDFKLTSDKSLKWYRSSDTAQRGFCSTCGSVLFWQGEGLDYISITAGSIDPPPALALDGHIYCSQAGSYYEIVGGNYQKAEW